MRVVEVLQGRLLILIKNMSLKQGLAAFYKKNGFGEVASVRPLTVPVYTGCTKYAHPGKRLIALSVHYIGIRIP